MFCSHYEHLWLLFHTVVVVKFTITLASSHCDYATSRGPDVKEGTGIFLTCWKTNVLHAHIIVPGAQF